MATVSAHLPALDAKLAHKRLSLEAERRRADGAREGHGALMADSFADTLIGRDGGMEPVTLDLGVMITDRALLSPDHGDVAHIEGYGPVPAEAVREGLRDALAEPADPEKDRFGPDGPQVRVVMRRLYLHPTAGELVAVESRGREFPPAMKRFLNWRDGTCRAPFCDAPVREYDHIVPVSAGGATSIDNGQGTCGYCNLHKEEDAVSVERVEDPDVPGHLVAWTGHGGTTVVTTPPPLGPIAPGAGEPVPTEAPVPAEEPVPADDEFEMQDEFEDQDGNDTGDVTGSADVAPCTGAEVAISCRIPDHAVDGSTVSARPPKRTMPRTSTAVADLQGITVVRGVRPRRGAARPSSHRAGPAHHRRPPHRAACSPAAPRRPAAPPARHRSS